jgi:type I restriction enzyme, S subunit
MTDTARFTDLLSSIVDNRGRTCPVGDRGIPLIATNCILNERLFPVHEKVRYVSDQTYRTWFRGHPKPGDIIFVCKGSPGNVALAPDPVGFCIAQDMVAVRADSALVYPKYLFAVLRSTGIQDQINNLHVGTLIPHFKKGDFGKLLIPIPDRVTQCFIGDMYFELSVKIESNVRIVDTLAELISATFKRTFEGPDSLEWPVQSIGEVATIVGGSTPRTAEGSFWGGPISWATPKDLSRLRSVPLLDTQRTITELGLQQISSGLLPAGTVLLSSRAPIGYLAIAEVPVAVNQGFIALLPSERLSNLYLWQWLKAHLEEVKARANGTTFLEVSKASFRPIPIVVPPESLMKAWTDSATAIYRLTVQKERESRTLARLRDTLLAKLLSEELRIPEAQVLVEDAV